MSKNCSSWSTSVISGFGSSRVFEIQSRVPWRELALRPIHAGVNSATRRGRRRLDLSETTGGGRTGLGLGHLFSRVSTANPRPSPAAATDSRCHPSAAVSSRAFSSAGFGREDPDGIATSPLTTLYSIGTPLVPVTAPMQNIAAPPSKAPASRLFISMYVVDVFIATAVRLRSPSRVFSRPTPRINGRGQPLLTQELQVI